MANRNGYAVVPPYEGEGLPLPAEVYPYSAGVVGGALGGVAMVVVATIISLGMGRGPWYPLNLIAATVIPWLQTAGPEVLGQLLPQALVVALALHTLLAAGIGFLFAVLLPALPGRPWIWSLVVGSALWYGVQFTFVFLVSPEISAVAWWQSFFPAQLAYALVLGAWIQHVGKAPAGRQLVHRRQSVTVTA